MCDGTGQRLFLRTLEEFARGSNAPSIPPVWDRHLLTAKVPPRVTPAHLVNVNEGVHDARDTTPHDPMVQRSFLFGPGEISAIRRLVPPDLRDRVTTFELLASFLWRCRTIALNCHPESETRLAIAVNARPFLRKPQLPPGYYGNAVTSPIAITTASELSGRPLEFAVRLVQEAKSSVTEEWIRSMIDLLGTEGGRNATIRETYIVSDVRRIGRDEVDLGWGPPVYGGLVEGGVWEISWLIRRKNKTGETETSVQVVLPEPAMERFAEELARVLERDESTSR